MGFLSHEIVRRAVPLVMAGAAGAAGAVLAQRRIGERRKLSLTPGPPTPDPQPPSPTPDPIPAPPPVTPPPAIEAPAVDVDLEQAVRSALLDAASDGAGAVDVEIVGGMVVLRGQVDSPETIRELERTAAGVPGVDGVRVLLHLPGRASRRSR